MQKLNASSLRPGGLICARSRSGVRCHALFGGTSIADRALLKAELLSAIAPLDRGAAASPEDQDKVDMLARQLERVNPNPASLKAPEINGKWRLVYTTSGTILGTDRPAPLRPSGPIYQYIDAARLRARNNESGPFFNAVTAELTPMSESKVFVQFKTFRIGNLIRITAPETATGELDTTYVDNEMRISRGDKGNLFVLLMEDPDAELASL